MSPRYRRTIIRMQTYHFKYGIATTDDEMNIELYKERFKELKKKSQNVSIENRKFAEKEAKGLLTKGKPKVYSMEEDEEHDNAFQNLENDQRTKLLNYSIRDYENWEQKQRKRNFRKDNGDLQEVAKLTYEKDLRRQFHDVPYKSTDRPRVQKTERDRKTGKIRIYDDKKLIDQLANDSRKLATERYNSRKKDIEREQRTDVPGSYINDKNKQFSQKLDRQLKKSDT